MNVRNELLDSVINTNTDEAEDDTNEEQAPEVEEIEEQNVEEEINQEQNVQDNQHGAEVDNNTSLSGLFKRKSIDSDDELFKRLLDSSCINLSTTRVKKNLLDDHDWWLSPSLL